MTDHYSTRRGEARPYAKMSEFRVKVLREAYASEQPRPTMASLARDFGLSVSTVHAIISRRYWKHVP